MSLPNTSRVLALMVALAVLGGCLNPRSTRRDDDDDDSASTDDDDATADDDDTTVDDDDTTPSDDDDFVDDDDTTPPDDDDTTPPDDDDTTPPDDDDATPPDDDDATPPDDDDATADDDDDDDATLDPSGTLYAADGKAGAVGNGYQIDPTDGSTIVSFPLTAGFTGIAVHPSTGEIYGTQSTAFGSSSLYSVNPLTLSMNVIGPLVAADGTNHGSIPDITFVGTTLFGWTEMSDQPIVINTSTAEVTVLGGGTSSFGSGMAADASGTIWLAPEGSSGTLYLVDPSTGTVTGGPTMSGGDGNGINSMTFLNGTLYGNMASNEGGSSTLVTIDTSTGAITTLGALPNEIDSIGAWPP